jgi:hypothetical protein
MHPVMQKFIAGVFGGIIGWAICGALTVPASAAIIIVMINTAVAASFWE